MTVDSPMVRLLDSEGRDVPFVLVENGPTLSIDLPLPAATPCSRCHHQYRHHAVTEDGYRCRACKCNRRFWR